MRRKRLRETFGSISYDEEELNEVVTEVDKSYYDKEN